MTLKPFLKLGGNTTIDDQDTFTFLERPKVDKCKGLFFRTIINNFSCYQYKIGQRIDFKFLKRKSCTGCEKCDWLWDDLREGDNEVDIPKHLNHGDIVELKVISVGRDWETGYIDEVDIGMVKVKND